MNSSNDLLCHDCQGLLSASELAINPYFDGAALLCTVCNVLCGPDGHPVKVQAGGVTQRIYEMAGAVMTETELLSTVADDDEELGSLF